MTIIESQNDKLIIMRRKMKMISMTGISRINSKGTKYKLENPTISNYFQHFPFSI